MPSSRTMAVYSVRDMERLFNGLDLRKINVVHITYYQVIPALAQYIAYAERLGIQLGELRGNLMNWYHQSAYVGMSAFPPDQALKLAVELVSFCTKNMPRWNTTNFFCYGIEEAIERVRELRATRDSARFERAMNDFEVAAKSFAKQKVSELGDDNLMLAAIEAARADATTGEMMGVLKSALTWGPPH